MSKYCGAFDLYDWFYMGSEKLDSFEERLKATRIFVGDKKYSTNITDERKLALYFPYLVATGSYHKDTKIKSTLCLTEVDYIRLREREMIDMYVETSKKAKKAFARVGKEFGADAVYKDRFCWREIGGRQDEDKEQIKEIITGVGNGATDFESIRFPSLSFYRDIWLKDLVNIYGYNEDFAKDWVYHRKKG